MGQSNLKLDIQKFASNGVQIAQAYETDVDIGNNTSYVYLEIKVTTNSTTYNNTGGAYVNITASSPNNSYGTGNVYFKVSKNANITVWSGKLGPFSHNSDGTSGNVNVNVSSYITSSTKPKASTSIGMSTIPRYANITSFAVYQRDETSVQFGYSVDSNCDYGWYSADNGGSWHDLPTNNIIGGLSPGTGYNFKLRVRRQDSQLTTDSGTVWQQTYSYPYPSSINNFTIGEGATVTLYNPLGRNCLLQLISNNDGSIIGQYSGTYNGPVNAEFKTEQAINSQYASIPNSQSGTYYAKVTYGSSVQTKGTGTYYVNANDCQPQFSNFTFEDINEKTVALTGNNQNCVLGYSFIKAIIVPENKATALRGATITKYRLVIGSNTNEQAFKSNENVELLITDTGGNKIGANATSFDVYAIDSRGFSTLVKKVPNEIINYSILKKNTGEVAQRVDENGEVVGISERVNLSFGGKMWYGNFGQVDNSLSVTYRYKETSSTEWITGTTVIEPTIVSEGENIGDFSFSGLIIGDTENGFDISKAYNLEVTVNDKLSSITYTISLSSGTPHIAYAKNGVSIMGKYDDETGGLLQCGGVRATYDIPNYSYISSESDEHIIKVGQYFDGSTTPKTIYRKRLFIIISSTGITTLSHKLPENCHVLDLRGVLVVNGINCVPIPYIYINENSNKKFSISMELDTTNLIITTSGSISSSLPAAGVTIDYYI